MNTITIELCEEDRARLDRIATLLEEKQCEKCVRAAYEYTKNLTNSNTPDTSTETPQNDDQAQPVEVAKPTEETPASAPPVATVDEPKPEYTKEDILALAQKLAAPNSTKREQAKTIVKSYAPKVSDIPADKYGEVMEKLTELDKGVTV